MPPRPDERRRQELLEQIEAIILAEGFRDLGIGELASRLNCSRSTLYKLAPSKVELIRSAFADFSQRGITEAEADADKEPSAAAKISTFVRTIQKWQAKGSFEFWRDVHDFDITRGVLDLRSARGYKIIQRYMDEGIASGEFRHANTTFLSYLSWMAARAARDPEVLERSGLTAGDAMGEVGRFVVYGMMKPPKS
jgi:AcrR family transcriptional regulator